MPARRRFRKTQIGEMWHRIAFDKRQQINPDSPADLGNTQSIFVEQFVVWAAIQARLGGEAVMAARLTGEQPVTITVRQSSDTDQIGLDWRARDVNLDKTYAVRSIIDPVEDGEFYDILAQTGVAP
jgi:head-tail adaptor